MPYMLYPTFCTIQYRSNVTPCPAHIIHPQFHSQLEVDPLHHSGTHSYNGTNGLYRSNSERRLKFLVLPQLRIQYIKHLEPWTAQACCTSSLEHSARIPIVHASSTLDLGSNSGRYALALPM